jgi:hypothetical protein
VMLAADLAHVVRRDTAVAFAVADVVHIDPLSRWCPSASWRLRWVDLTSIPG